MVVEPAGVAEEVTKDEEKEEEALVAAINVNLLHRRVGHLGKAGMERMAREGLVRGLEGGLGLLGPTLYSH